MTLEIRVATTVGEWRNAAAWLAPHAVQCAHIIHILENAAQSGRSRLPVLLAYDGAQPVGIATAAPMTLLHVAGNAGFSATAITNALADAVAHRVDLFKLLITQPHLADIALQRLAEMREIAPPARSAAHKILSLVAASPLPRDAPAIRVRIATANDAALIAESVGELTRTELGYDPRTRPNYPASLQAQIARGQYFLAQSQDFDQPVAFCSVSIRNAQTVRVDNFVVPAHLRGRGYGKAAAAAFAGVFLHRAPTVSVLVRSENAIARAVYDAVGFTECGELQYLYFS